MKESINRELKRLYMRNWYEMSRELNEINSDEGKELKATNPLLIKIDEDKYNESDIKIMIFGQETNSWENLYNDDYNKTLNIYEEFFNSNYCMKTYGGQFWNGFKNLKNKLENKYHNKSIYFIWNNICKIGNAERNKNRAANYIMTLEEKYFNIIKEEIDIIKPDIIIFFTGPNYDIILNKKISNLNFEEIQGYKIRELSKLSNDWCTNVFRTYHPNYLYRGKGRIEKYFNTIIENIKL